MNNEKKADSGGIDSAGICLTGTVFQTLSIASIVPNLLLILTVSFGFMRGKKEGMFVGFFCGLLIDIFMEV